MFRVFVSLPQELQDSIWQQAIDSIAPRTVQLSITIPNPPAYSGTNIPNVLHACQTSRRLALRRWQLSFALPHIKRALFFDFTADILWLDAGDEAPYGGTLLISVLSEAERKQVRRIALSLERYTIGSQAFIDKAVEKLHYIPSLSEIIVPVGLSLGRRLVDLVPVPAGAKDEHERMHGQAIRHIQMAYQRQGWICPEFTYMALSRGIGG